MAGRGGVPNNASTAIVNLVAVNPAAPGYATIYPCTSTPPDASSINFFPGDVIANSSFAKLDATGDLCILASTDTHLVIDVTGYITG